MKHFFLIVSILILSVITGFSQDEVLLTIDSREISKDEFVRIYQKNNSPNISSDIKTVDEYLELFINFKLKVIEAENKGLDTMTSYTTELDKYTMQLAKPYFMDNDMENKLIEQALVRSKQEVRASYIFIQIPRDASPKDTLDAYNKAKEAKNRVKQGESFKKVAIEVSESNSVKRDGGDTWYISILTSPYPIENFIFSSEIGDISDPIRVPSGYFVLKVTDKRDAQGEILASHIMVALPQGSSEEDSLKAVEKVNEIQQKIDAGEDFAELAKLYSDDKGSAVKGGELGWFGTGKMVREFEKTAFSLEKNGDVSKPVKTIFGWHFIKRIDRRKPVFDEDYKKEITAKLKKDKRYDIVYSSVITNTKKENNFKETRKFDEFYTKVDSSIFKGAWNPEAFDNSTTVLFSFAEKKYTEKDFASFLATTQKRQYPKNINSFIDEKYNEFVEIELKNYKMQQLPNENEDYKYIVQEYHDGLLLFDITEKMVWNKAVQDTTGLSNFHEKNKTKYYQKLNLTIYSYKDEKTLKKAKKVLKSKEKNGYTDSIVVTKVDKTGEKFKIVETGIYKKDDNKSATYVYKKYENNEIENSQKFVVFAENNEIIYLNDNFPYVKGLVTADYQIELEKKWLENLRSKYEVTINQEVLDKVKKEVDK